MEFRDAQLLHNAIQMKSLKSARATYAVNVSTNIGMQSGSIATFKAGAAEVAVLQHSILHEL
jgi:hypothetical protein